MASRETLQGKIRLFGRMLTRLEDVAALESTDVVRDALIQRFEFTFEAMWKALQAALRYEGGACSSPLGCLQETLRFGLIEADEDLLLRFLEYRNLTVHTYDEKLAEDVARFVRAHLSTLRRIYQALISRYGT